MAFRCCEPNQSPIVVKFSAIVCTLTESELQERRRTVLDAIRSKAVDVQSIVDGYAYSFISSPEVLAQLTQLIELERQCCQFLTFKLIVAPGQPITLEVSGPTAAKPIIAEFFGT
jgi:hypothetical protein